MNNYEQAMAKLLATGWQQGDPMPAWFMEQSNDVSPVGGLTQNAVQADMGPFEAPAEMGPPSSPPAAGSQSIYDRLGPEGLETLLGQKSLDDQMSQAAALRDAEGPEGMYTKNMYVAANPLSHLASGVEKYRARKDVKRLRDEEKEGLKVVIDMLRNKPAAVVADPDVGLGLGRGA